MITILNYVLLGILIYAVCIPLIESITAVIIQGLEILKGYFVLKVTELQEKTNEIGTKPNSTQVIGFTIPDDNLNYEEEDDDD